MSTTFHAQELQIASLSLNKDNDKHSVRNEVLF